MKLTLFKHKPALARPGVTILRVGSEDLAVWSEGDAEEDGDGTRYCAVERQGQDRPDVFIPPGEPDEALVHELFEALGLTWTLDHGDLLDGVVTIDESLKRFGLDSVFVFSGLGATWFIHDVFGRKIYRGPESGRLGQLKASQALLRNIREGAWLEEKHGSF